MTYKESYNYIKKMISLFNIIIIYLYLHSTISIKLTNNQIQQLGKLKHTQFINKQQINSINNIIFRAFKGFSINKAFEFKNIHKHKCFHIPNDELIYYSFSGLHKATLKYNGSYNFILLANHYIRGDLLNCISDRCHNSILPSYFRKMSSSKLNNLLSLQTINDSKLNLVSSNDWIFDKNNKKNNNNLSSILDLQINNNEYREVWLKINKIDDPFFRRIVNLKFDYNFNKIRSNKQLSELMSCSEEHIRKTLLKYIINNNELFNELINYF